MTARWQPRWYHYAIGIYLFAVIVMASGGLDLDERRPDEVLIHTSVYVEPGAAGLIDEDRVRRAVGDRPIVVVAADDSSVACWDVAEALADVIVLAPSTGGEFTACRGDNGRGFQSRYFAQHLAFDVERKLAFVEHDATDLVVQYVRGFDAEVAAGFPGEPAPVRPPPPPDDGPAVADVFPYVVLAVVFGGLALFGAYVTREMWRNAQWSGARTRRWRAETDARLNRLADLVLRPEAPRGRADAERRAGFAKRYVLALHEFGKTRKPERAAGLEAMLTALEAEAGSTPEPPRKKRKRRRGRR